MDKRYDLCVLGGCGHVGLPLAVSFAAKRLKTVIYDNDAAAVRRVNRGEALFKEAGLGPLLKRTLNRTLFASTDPRTISRAKFVVLVIGTPVDEFLNPKIKDVFDCLKSYFSYFKNGQYLILRSTLYPGTTRKIADYFAKRQKTVNVSFCPERIAEGRALQEIPRYPQIISAFDKKTERAIAGLFRVLTKEIIVLSPMEAEVAKLFTNVWRYIQFAIPNQFLIIANKYGLDFFKIFKAIKYKYPRAQGFHGPGFVAGPCLFKDTMQLAAFNNNDFMLGHAAMLINEGLPQYLANYLKSKYALSKMTIGILGMAFKANSDDPRSSLSYKLKKILELEGRAVLCTDAFIKDPNFVPLAKVLRRADLIIVAAPHSTYRQVKFKKNKKVVDVWNFYGRGMEF